MPYLVSNLITSPLFEDIRLYMLKLKLFIRSTYHKFSNSPYIIDIIRWLLLAIASIFFAFVALQLSISVSDYLYGEETTNMFLTILRDLIAELAFIILLLPLFMSLQISPFAWFILGVSWLFLLYFCYGDEDDEEKPKR